MTSSWISAKVWNNSSAAPTSRTGCASASPPAATQPQTQNNGRTRLPPARKPSMTSMTGSRQASVAFAVCARMNRSSDSSTSALIRSSGREPDTPGPHGTSSETRNTPPAPFRGNAAIEINSETENRNRGGMAHATYSAVLIRME